MFSIFHPKTQILIISIIAILSIVSSISVAIAVTVPVTIMMISSISMTIPMPIAMIVISIVMTPIPVVIATVSAVVVAVVTITRRCFHVLGWFILNRVLVSGYVYKYIVCVYITYVSCPLLIGIPFDITDTNKMVIDNDVNSLNIVDVCC